MKKLFGVLLAVIFVCALVAPAMAEWSFEGQAGIFTEIVKSEDADGNGDDIYQQHPWDTLNLSAKYKGDKISGEAAIENDDNGGSGDYSIYWDKVWAQVDLSAFSIKLGMYDALSFNPVGSPPGKYGNTGIGSNIGGTKKYNIEFIFKPAPKMSLSFMISQPGFAAWDYAMPKNLDATDGDGDGVGVLDSIELLPTMPTIEAALTGFAPFMWKVYAGYESWDVRGTGDGDDGDAGVGAGTAEESVDAYIIGVVVRPKLGPAKISVGANYSTNMYISQGSPWQYRPAFPFYPWNWAMWEDDTERLAVAGSAAFQLTEMVGVTFGAGWQQFTSTDDWEDTMIGYYINFPIQVTKNFRILPYFYVEDQDDMSTGGGTTIEQGKTTAYGAYWSINF